MSASDSTPSQKLDVTSTLSRWAGQQLALPHSPALKPLGGDAGFRCYFRFLDEPKAAALIAVFAPPEVEKNNEFVAIAEHLVSLGLMAPQIFAKDLSQGFFLLEDLGEQHLFDVLCADNVFDLYSLASEQLIKLQMGPEPVTIPRYDRSLLMAEMGLFTEWFLPQLLSYNVSASENKVIMSAMDILASRAQQQPYGFVHRDFHSRNIMLTPKGLALIDFQDAVWGPISYDLVSLIRDCYVYWPQDVVSRCLQAHWQIMPAELRGDMDFKNFQKAVDWMGLQRHIKVLGIFARLAIRDGKKSYLEDLPLVIRYVIEVAEKYPELEAFAAWFKSQLIPLCEGHVWYQDYREAGEGGAHLRRQPTDLSFVFKNPVND